MIKKKKSSSITVTFGATWWKDPHGPGYPQGTHSEADVRSFDSLSALATFIEKRRMPLDKALPLQVAKTHQPYIIWAGLKAIEYRDKNGDMVEGIVRRAPAVMPSRLLPFDIDGATPSALKALTKRLKGISHFYYYTASDNPMSRRARLVVLCDQLLFPVKEACLRFEQWIMTELGAGLQRNIWTLPDSGQITFDRSMNDPAHFAFLPPGDNPVWCFEGEPVKVRDLPELTEAMTHSVRTGHHTKDHAKRMAEFNRSSYDNKELITEYLNTHLADCANNNARSDGTYGWGRICGALGDFVGTEHEQWAEDLLVAWSMQHGAEWAEQAGIDEAEWEDSIRAEFGKWQNPYKTIFDMVKKERKAERQSFIDSLTDEDLDDGDEAEEVVQLDMPTTPVKKKKTLPGAAPSEVAEVKKKLPAVAGKFEPYGAELQAEYDHKSGDIVSAFNCSENLRWILDKRKAQLCINLMTGELEMWYSNGRIVSNYEVIVSDLTDFGTFHRIATGTIERHITKVALERSYHPVAAALHGHEWDGVHRVDKVIDCFDFTDRDYGRAIMRKWLLSAYAAVRLEEHFEAKLVPILVAGQSKFKSNAIGRIAGLVPRQFHDEQIDLKDKDSLIRATGSHIIEWAEMGNLHKSDVDKVKSFISRKVDAYRAAYARTNTRKPRQSVFIGTANDNGRPLLVDQSGNLRFAPLTVGTVRIDEMNGLLGWQYDNGRLTQPHPDLLVQFWLEIASWFDAGETWHVEGELRDRQQAVNQKFTSVEAVDMAVRDFIEDNQKAAHAWKRAGEIAKELGYPPQQAQMVGYALARLTEAGRMQVKDYGPGNSNRYWWPVPGASDLDD